MTSQNKKYVLMLFIMLFASFSTMTMADTGDKYNLNIAISGTMVANGSCTFNQGGTLSVDFGTVKLKDTGNNTVQLDGEYQRPLTSDFYCTGDTAGLLQMSFSSASGSYETFNGINVLGTSRGIVAVELLVNDVPQKMGTWFNVDQKTPPKLKVQLVQTDNINTSGVTSGDIFSASGTLTMAFN